MTVQFAAVVIYARDVEVTISFYEKHFFFKTVRDDADRIVELVNESGGCRILVHQAGKAVKQGQSTVKLIFAVEDVAAFCVGRAVEGLDFGPQHEAVGYVYANARDPSGNPISVSSRAFRQGGQGAPTSP